MPLETGTYISDLVATNPAHTDSLSQADAHMRLLKAALLATFPNIDGAMTLTQDQINLLATRLHLAAEPTLGIERSSAGILTIVGGLLRGNGAVPPGAIMDFAMATAPTGWVACDGTSYTTAAQPDLFAAIGYLWGGSGANFNVPNFMTRYRRHRDNSTVSGAVGSLQAAIVEAHTHSVSVSGNTSTVSAFHTHAVSGSTVGRTGAHQHTTAISHVSGVALAGGGAHAVLLAGGSASGMSVFASSDVTDDHTHAFSVNSGLESANHTHSFSFAGTSGSYGSTETRPISATVLTCIKL
jgi:microcystin-dependent protein